MTMISASVAQLGTRLQSFRDTCDIIEKHRLDDGKNIHSVSSSRVVVV